MGVAGQGIKVVLCTEIYIFLIGVVDLSMQKKWKELAKPFMILSK